MRTEKLKIQQARYYRNNAQKLKKNAAEWARNNRNKRREYVSSWQKRNPENCNARHRKYMRLHPEVRRANESARRSRRLKVGGAFTPKQWKALCNRYKNVCLCCKKKKALEADHVVPIVMGGSGNIYNIQPLCKSCNCKKGIKTVDYR